MNGKHKTFAGGYTFENFEGQPSKELIQFKPASNVIGTVIEPGGAVTASDVLDALNLTDLTGPGNALVKSEGKIMPHNVTAPKPSRLCAPMS